LRRVTVAMVAREAGVSTATVSRALTESRAVSAANAKLVREAAERLGYSGNSIARALRVNSTRTIGMLVPSISNPFFTTLVEAVEHHLVELGLNLFLCDSRNDPTIEASRLTSLTQGNVDGILVSPCHSQESRQALERACAIAPVVQIDRQVSNLDTDWVGLDDSHAMGLIARHLAEQGVNEAAFVTSTTGSSSAQYRLESIMRSCSENGVKIRSNRVLDGAFTLAWGATAADCLVEAGSLPDAIICSDDLIALGLIGRLTQHGITVPTDVLVTGFDDIDYASLNTPSLTTVRQPVEQIAAEAVRLLRENIDDSDRSKVTISLRGDLLVRRSSVRAIGQ
jgi:LacI family transcriptional regulator